MEYKDFNDYELLSYISEQSEEANNILIKKYEPLIAKIATKMLPYCKNSGLEKSDLIQEGMIGLNHAISRYQEQHDVLFYTYAKTCIERKIISVVIAANRNKNKILNESLSYDDDTTAFLNFIKDNNSNPEEVIMGAEVTETLINDIKKGLTNFEEQVFELLINGFRYKEIAEILDRDSKSIDNAIQRLKSKIRKILENNKF